MKASLPKSTQGRHTVLSALADVDHLAVDFSQRRDMPCTYVNSL